MEFKRDEISLEEAQRLFAYNPDTGEITWKVSAGTVRPGRVAGRVNSQGYRQIRYRSVYYQSHRIAWLLAYGSYPETVIDHINGDRTDNRLTNLRAVSVIVNSQNQKRAHKSNRSSGLLGVTWNSANRRWQAAIRYGGRVNYLGSFKDPHEAHAAYVAAKRRFHEGNTL